MRDTEAVRGWEAGNHRGFKDGDRRAGGSRQNQLGMEDAF